MCMHTYIYTTTWIITRKGQNSSTYVNWKLHSRSIHHDISLSHSVPSLLLFRSGWLRCPFVPWQIMTSKHQNKTEQKTNAFNEGTEDERLFLDEVSLCHGNHGETRYERQATGEERKKEQRNKKREREEKKRIEHNTHADRGFRGTQLVGTSSCALRCVSATRNSGCRFKGKASLRRRRNAALSSRYANESSRVRRQIASNE